MAPFAGRAWVVAVPAAWGSGAAASGGELLYGRTNGYPVGKGGGHAAGIYHSCGLIDPYFHHAMATEEPKVRAVVTENLYILDARKLMT